MGSVGVDVGAEFCCVGLEPSASRTVVQRTTTSAGGGLMTITSAKKNFKKYDVYVIVLYSGLVKLKT